MPSSVLSADPQFHDHQVQRVLVVVGEQDWSTVRGSIARLPIASEAMTGDHQHHGGDDEPQQQRPVAVRGVAVATPRTCVRDVRVVLRRQGHLVGHFPSMVGSPCSAAARSSTYFGRMYFSDSTVGALIAEASASFA